MLKKGCILLLLLYSGCSLIADNLLKNSNFSEKSQVGLPLYWEFRGATLSGSLASDNYLKLGGGKAGEGIFLIQQGLSLAGGVKYDLSYKVKSSKKSKCRVYCEWTRNNNGKKDWRNSGSGVYDVGDQWENHTVSFEYGVDSSPAHLVLNVKDDGEVEFKDLLLEINKAKTQDRSKLEVDPVKEKSHKEQFGGQWYLYSGSMFTQNAGQDVLSVKQNTVFRFGAGAELKDIPLEIGCKYTLSYAVIGVGNAGSTTGFHPFQIQVAFDGIKDIASSSWDDVWNDRFQKKQFSFGIPANASSGKINIGLVVHSTGAVYFTNMKLEKAEKNQAEKYNIHIDQPCYRNMIFSSMAISEIKGKVQTDSSIRNVKIVLKRDNEILYSGDLQNQEKSVSFSIPAQTLAAGKYQFEAVLYGSNGIAATLCTEIMKLPPAAMEVVQGSDRNFYINGKAFFPIAFWEIVSAGKNETRTLYYAARQGVNLYRMHASDETSVLAILNTADKNGLKVVLTAGFAENMEGEHLQMWKHRIANVLTRKVTEHPALFGYFLVDEPSWLGLPLKNLIVSYQALKELDPYHPVWINAAPRGSLDEHREYSKAADVYGIDIYPVPYPSGHSALEDKSLTSVGKYAQFVYEATDAGKAVWMALQGFSWREMDGKAIGTGYPTYIESRFMAYDALLNNANSIGYWGTQYILTPDFYDILFKVTREISDVSGLLVYGKIVAGAMADNNAISCREFDVNGKKYLIALNTSTKQLPAKINGTFTSPELLVFKENRTVAVRDGKFTDNFKPFEVHVYGEAELPPPVNALPPANPELDKKGNPFYKSIELRLKAVFYEGRANWIWEKSNISVTNSKVWLCKKFVIEKTVKSARLLICADDQSTVYLNGQLLGSANAWNQMEQFDCTNIVKKGNNMLAVAAADAGRLPCGLLADFKIETGNGETISIISDETWRASDKAIPDWLNPAAVQTWGSAKTVAPYGGGEWGKRVQLP